MRRFRLFAVAALLTLASVGVVPLVGAPAADAAASRCGGWLQLTCVHNDTTLWTGMLGVTPRTVHWQVPTGTPPKGGWPAVVMYSPSLYSADLAWSANKLLPAGAYYETQTIQKLLDSGFAVLTPESHLSGFTFWDTNVPLLDYDISPDSYFIEDLLSNMGTGTFGSINMNRLFATGMSSGGYMTSRMAVSYGGTFKALAIQSGSYATCLGPVCSVPSTLPANHAPTLFLHGKIDPIVPIATMYPYRDKLKAQGVPTKTVTRTWAVHEFLPEAPGEIVAWFKAYDPGPTP